jgi:hypothetical protein
VPSYAPVLLLADALVATFASATTLSMPLLASREELVPTFDITQLHPKARVTVVPGGLTGGISGELHSRGATLFTYEVQTGVHRQAKTQADRDAMLAFQQELIDLVFCRPLGDFFCVSFAVPTLYSAEHLQQQGVFASVISFGFQHERRR